MHVYIYTSTFKGCQIVPKGCQLSIPLGLIGTPLKVLAGTHYLNINSINKANNFASSNFSQGCFLRLELGKRFQEYNFSVRKSGVHPRMS